MGPATGQVRDRWDRTLRLCAHSAYWERAIENGCGALEDIGEPSMHEDTHQILDELSARRWSVKNVSNSRLQAFACVAGSTHRLLEALAVGEEGITT